jgi:hypothetical protein
MAKLLASTPLETEIQILPVNIELCLPSDVASLASNSFASFPRKLGVVQ